MSTCNTEYFVGQGKIYVAPRASNGAINGGWTELGDTNKVEVTTKQTFLDEYESCSGNRSIVMHIPIQSDWTFTVDAKSFSKENLARAFYGTASAVTTGSITGEAISVYGLNQIAPLKHPAVSAVVVKQGATTLTVGTDYTVDATNGTVTLVSATNVTGVAPYALTVDYTHAAYEKVEANTQTITEYAFRFEGINLATKKAVIANVHRVSLDMAATLSLIDTKSGQFTMAGMMLPDASSGAGESQYLTIVKAV
jgi:hypothetical protein